MNGNNHIWNFLIIGGVKRVNLESGADLEHLSSLDPKLWTALSCPVNDLELDAKTLSLIDADQDGQIHVPDIINAVNWILTILKDPNDLLKQEEFLKLSAINDQTEQGNILLNSAKTILKNLGKEDFDSISVNETSATDLIFAGTKFNGDGIITEDSSNDPEMIAVLNKIIQYQGNQVDRGGKPGINLDLVNAFMDNCKKYSAWYSLMEKDASTITPFGENTEIAYANYSKIKSKVEDYFMRCRLAAFETQTTDILNLQIAQVETITAKDITLCMEEIAAFPLAKIEGNLPLHLSSGINPAWENSIKDFRNLTVNILFQEKNSLTEADWNAVKETFKPYAKWIAEKEGVTIEPLGINRIRQILNSKNKEQLISLIEKDNELTTEVNNIIEVDKLVRYYRDLFRLLKNFVTFFDFYSSESDAIFQAGTLFIDQRSCNLCIKVRDMSKHAIMASFSGMYLIYCDCKSKTSNEKMTIVAALTNGDIDNLMVGRNALFFDKKGIDWDATIVKIVDNPISIRQAFFSPYRKLSRFIDKQIHKFASAEDEKVSSTMTKHVENVPAKAEEIKTKKESPAPFDIGKFVGIFAAIGLAIGAIGSVLAAAAAGFFKLEWWKMPFAIAGLLLAISGPSMIIAYLNLRKRNLAPLLEANGWAINARVIINIAFGNTLTHLAVLPKGAKININDPYSKKKRPILLIIIILTVVISATIYLLWRNNLIHFRF